MKRVIVLQYIKNDGLEEKITDWLLGCPKEVDFEIFYEP